VPTAFYRLVGLDVYDSDSQTDYVTLQRADFRDRNVWTTTEKTSATFEVRGDKINIYPEPNWSGTLRVHYIYTCPRLDSDADTFDYANYWQDMVVFDVAIKCAMRLDEDATGLRLERDRLDMMLRGKTTKVDNSGPKTVRDVYGHVLRQRRGDYAEDVRS
jgi:hypothetical protein